MSEKTFTVRYSQLHPEAIKEELVTRYELNEILSCRLFDNGINDIYIIKTGDETYYLRISQTGRYIRQDYEDELNVINTLSEKDISVAVPLPCKDGSYLWEINAPEGARYSVLFTEAKSAPSEDKVKQGYNLGCLVANLHKVADQVDFKVNREPIDLTQLAEKPLEAIKKHLSHRPEDYKFFQEAADMLCNYVRENLGKDKPYYGYCHGDVHSGNVFFHGEEPKLFDFDCMGYGWRAYDICVYAWNQTFGNEKYIECDAWKAYLEGYNSVRQLNEIELKAINVFAALRDLWLMGLHADMIERNAGCSWYNNGYFDYHKGIFRLWYERAFPKEEEKEKKEETQTNEVNEK